MAFDLYFAGKITSLEVNQYIRDRHCNRLFSFADKPGKSLALYEDKEGKLFTDSGAFGVHHSDKVITLDEYIDYINNTPRVDLFAALDVIPFPVLNAETAKDSAEKSWENYIYMLERVKPEYRDKIVPTYHYGEDYKYLERMLNGHEGYIPPYIAFGGRAGITTKYLYPCLDKFFDVIKHSNHSNVKTHAFGITVPKILEAYPFTSADSTSWLKTGIHGGIFIESLDGTINVSDRTLKDPNNYWHKDKHIQNMVNEEVERYGYSMKDLSENFRARLKYNIDYFLRWEKNYKHTPIIKIRRKKLF